MAGVARPIVITDHNPDKRFLASVHCAMHSTSLVTHSPRANRSAIATITLFILRAALRSAGKTKGAEHAIECSVPLAYSITWPLPPPPKPPHTIMQAPGEVEPPNAEMKFDPAQFGPFGQEVAVGRQDLPTASSTPQWFSRCYVCDDSNWLPSSCSSAGSTKEGLAIR